MANKPRPSTADYVAIGLSPLLIMALIGSLVFFLVEILYRGDYEGRLQYILFFYVFGAVLVARISMEFGISDRAPLYGLVLAVAAPARGRPVVAVRSRAVDVRERAVRGRVAVEPVSALRHLVVGVGVGHRRGAVDRVQRGHQSGDVRVLDQTGPPPQPESLLTNNTTR